MRKSELLIAENAMMKLQIETLYGGTSHQPSDQVINPALENIFLKNVLEFEKKMSAVKRIKLFDFIGAPTFKKGELINEKEKEAELDLLLERMQEHNVCYLFEDHHPLNEVYFFLTEILFQIEIDDLRMDGMTTVFCFETEGQGD